MKFSKWERWSPLTGVLAIACWFVAVMPLSSGSPSDSDSNTKIVSYYASHSHQVQQISALLVFLAGTLLMLGFLGALRSRLFDAEGAPGRVATIGFAAGVASTVFFQIAATFFTSPALAVNSTGKFQLDPNTYRLINDAGFAFWVAAVVTAAVLVWAASAIALKAAVLPKWFAWLGVLAGILQLFAVFFIPTFIFWGWILIASLLLFFRRTPVRA